MRSCNNSGQWDGCTQQTYPSTENCCTATDEDCDGTVGANDTDCQNCPVGSSGASCSTGMSGSCATGTYNCTYQAGTCTYEWGTCVPPTGSETNPISNKCNGVDDNCNGTIDEGTTLEGRIRLMEIFPQSLMSTMNLGAESGVLFMNWDGHTSGYHAIWGLASSSMRSAGDAAATRSLFNNSLGGIDVFQSNIQAQNVDSAMFVPTGGFGWTADHLLFFIDGITRTVNLSTLQVTESPISNLGIPSGGGSLAGNITAAAFVSAGDWSADYPDPTDMGVVISSGQAWLYCATCGAGGVTGWAGPNTDPSIYFTAGINSYISSFSQIDSLTVWREPGSVGILAMTTTSGQLLYTALDSNYGTWSSMAITQFTCQQ